MTYKQIEASRELRLWIGQVIVPAVTMAVALASIPEVRNAASTKLEQLKWKLIRGCTGRFEGRNG